MKKTLFCFKYKKKTRRRMDRMNIRSFDYIIMRMVSSRVFIGIAQVAEVRLATRSPVGSITSCTIPINTQKNCRQCNYIRFYNNFREDDSYLKRYNGLLTRIYRDSPTSFGPNRVKDTFKCKTLIFDK
ncbi:unnamed protein product [Chrysodeixis includens]|uniref:Uncharacterized protein n=1 Tax=Chrysodeixis includens TaxID=689277 RepID=A0A9N8Q1H8_CHRIL|nr:unnamed protein product [Chrysodeixis includens]